MLYVCSNQECGKSYFVENEKCDDGFCSFECWKKVNCLEPSIEQFEKIEIEVGS